MAHFHLLFASAATADYLVAGIPAAARAVREIALAAGDKAGAGKCTIAVPGGWSPGHWTRSELTRLGPALDIDIVDLDSIDGSRGEICILGEALIGAGNMDGSAASAGPPAGHSLTEALAAERAYSEAHHIARLEKAGRTIIAATGKAGDGIVSRYVNRPISQAISRRLLRIPGITPMHATFGTVALGIAMAYCLFFGGGPGLIAGALLFQAASIFDGVDGEIARATFRTSPTGAMLDSLTDAATNLAFFAGFAFNLWQQGFVRAAAFGAAGLTLFAVGLFLIGRRTHARGSAFTFDAIKHHFRARQSRVMKWLTWIAMRDFFAAAATVLILAGLAPHALVAFAVGAAGWFFVTITVLLSTRTPRD